MTEPQLLPGRSCVACTQCCKLMPIRALAKPRGKWCEHCAVGTGCTIYERRPDECSAFFCGWLLWPRLGDHWHPATCGMVVVSENGGSRLSVYVDPAAPDAWLEEPFLQEILRWAAERVPQMQTVLVIVGDRTIAILPHGAMDLGELAPDERVVLMEYESESGPRYEAAKMKTDDPRIAHLEGLEGASSDGAA